MNHIRRAIFNWTTLALILIASSTAVAIYALTIRSHYSALTPEEELARYAHASIILGIMLLGIGLLTLVMAVSSRPKRQTQRSDKI